MNLYTLYGGRSKKKMKRLETNSLKKCENYRDALITTPSTIYKWFEIREASPEEELKIHKSQNKWTGYNESGPKIIRKGNK